nr:hypothetical protein [Paenibacillus xylanexedens]
MNKQIKRSVQMNQDNAADQATALLKEQYEILGRAIERAKKITPPDSLASEAALKSADCFRQSLRQQFE